MATFDWDDVELTNIIWGEAGESDDHIVPYPNRNEEKRLVLIGDLANKEKNTETSGVSPIEQKKPSINADRQVDIADISKYDIRDHSPRFGLNSWPDVSDASVIDVEKSDPDNMGTNESNNVITSLEGGFSTDETPQFGKASEHLQNPSEDTEKSDYVCYNWANIESFDDLDRIFNNDNPIFGDVNVGYVDESWASCKDGNSCPSKLNPASSDSSNLPLGALSSTSDGFDDKPQYTLDLEESFLSVYKKVEGKKSQSQDVQARKATVEHFVGNSKLLMNEETPGIDEKSQMLPKQLDQCNAATVNAFPVKGNEQKRFMKDQKLKETSKKQMQDSCATRSTTMFEQVNNQYAPSMFKACPPMVLDQQKQVQGTELFQRKNFSGPLLGPPLYGNMVYHYPSTSHLSSKFQPVQENRELALANPVKKSVDAARNPPAMTPEEKIEKLRRRQQLRVFLAIQKQQQQFGNSVSVENSTIERGDVEVDENSGFPSLDLNSVVGPDDDNAVTMPLSICSMEESVLRQLQASISRLDMQIRLCIRDSLFRLAKSAIQRHCPSDTSSANTSTRDEINKDSDNREGFTGIPDLETNTNPIDRIVAHLLFYTPMESSGELSETPNTPVSATPFYERKPNSSKSLAIGYVPERFESPQVMFPHASKIPCTNVEKGRSENVPCLDAVENASRDEATTDGGHVNGESSKS